MALIVRSTHARPDSDRREAVGGLGTPGAYRCGVVALALTGFTFAAPVTARGAANAPISGGFSVTQTASNAAPVQLVTGTDGHVWFLTASSELGTIAANGQATL